MALNHRHTLIAAFSGQHGYYFRESNFRWPTHRLLASWPVPIVW